ncbi:hypothetical protein O181_005473 [Austropuccinia psidii MF-1]|uniref:Uncharacterized protein n=1 Tax=Austropuccinia psidii MF-1 TaxID=1389203 RepID=A0A9Q3GFK7_9BASI|nr:hypothetical protein [Austropuccinia psidii MF-1]
MGFKGQSKFSFSSPNNTDFFPLHIEKNPPNPPQQDSHVPCMPSKQTLWQPTPGTSGTQWLQDLSREPSQQNEPPIPGLSQSSEPCEDTLTSCPAAPASVIIIDDMLSGAPPPLLPPRFQLPPLHSHDEAQKEVTDLRPTVMIPQEIVQESCWRIANCSTSFPLWMQLIEMRCTGNSGRN